MKTIDITGYNLNMRDASGNWTTAREKHITRKVSFSCYADLVQQMKAIHAAEGLEYLKSAAIPFYRRDRDLQCVEIVFDHHGELSFRLQGGEIWSAADVAERAQQIREDADDECLLDRYVQEIKNGRLLGVSFMDFMDDIDDLELCALDDCTHNLPVGTLDSGEVWSFTNSGQSPDTLDWSDGAFCLDDDLRVFIEQNQEVK